MKIEDDLKMHSHYHEELFGLTKMLRRRVHDQKTQVDIMSYALTQCDKNILEVVRSQRALREELKEDLKNLADIVQGLTLEQYRKISVSDFVLEIFRKPKWLFMFVLFLTASLGAEQSFLQLLKHMWG